MIIELYECGEQLISVRGLVKHLADEWAGPIESPSEEG